MQAIRKGDYDVLLLPVQTRIRGENKMMSAVQALIPVSLFLHPEKSSGARANPCSSQEK
uniref:hypothetical protein n=1 Tax=Candidatus Electrothrix sp. TaxID=2170559 RepID=UPI0040579D05